MTQFQINEEFAWQQLIARDRDAAFYYGVRSTGVFCRPGCASRMPLRENTRFFGSSLEAKDAGFRACQRCKPEEPATNSRVPMMCSYIEKRSSNVDRPVTLAELGRAVGLSPFSAQKLFKQSMGVTPAEYQRSLRAIALRTNLRQEYASITDAIFEAGYGSSSRAYETNALGMTPGRFLAGGRGESIRFAAEQSSLGWMIVASTDRGLCWIALGDSAAELEAGLRSEFPQASITQDASMMETIKTVLEQVNQDGMTLSNLPLDLRGTAFQLRVWKALQQIPIGETRSYSQLAAEIGNPAATRAVARACAMNRVALLVPCHRVIGASGSLTGYRWGVELKRQLLAAERR